MVRLWNKGQMQDSETRSRIRALKQGSKVGAPKQGSEVGALKHRSKATALKKLVPNKGHRPRI